MNQTQAIQLVRDTFESAFAKAGFIKFIKNLLTKYEEAEITLMGNFIPEAFKEYVSKYERVGKYTDSDDKRIDILVVRLKRETAIERARSMQRNFVAGYLQGKYGSSAEKDAALVAFVSPDETDWRFSLVKLDYVLEEKEGQVRAKEEFTPSRRWSFLVGAHEKSHTAQSRLVPLMADDEHQPTLAELEEAFNIETVTKEFFEKYRALFIWTKEELDKALKASPATRADFEKKGVNTVDLAKKLLGQIIFLYYLQKKGWFGVPRDGEWGTGSKGFLRELFEKKHGGYKNFFNDILEPLFYEALRIDRSHDDHYYSRFDCKIPFLNGGLFDPMGNYDWVKTDILLPDKLFSNTAKTKEGDTGDGILDVFDRYNFTVREDEPFEKEVAIDPELLGKAYEKFNAIRPDNFDEFLKALKSGKKGDESKFNKQYGVYYTPREIVHYMCQQSLINYLAAELEGKASKEEIALLIQSGETLHEHEVQAAIKATKTYSPKLSEAIRANAALIDQKLAAIRVCDPAVGSGAFPVGMMSEIVRTRDVLKTWTKTLKTVYDFKRACIENSLYGVDIDPGAVEIAKLRLWLSLIVDEDDIQNIKPLPNLDYKIVCGNSLVGFPEGGWENSWGSGGKEIESLIHQHFNETNVAKKNELKARIDEKIHSRYRNSLKAFGYQVSFDFQTVFLEVYKRIGGFNVVIANPPYGTKFNKDDRTYLKNRFPVVSDYEIFQYFIFACLKQLNKNGVLQFIIPNTFALNITAKNTRDELVTLSSVTSLVDFSDFSIFEDASVRSVILTVDKQTSRMCKVQICPSDVSEIQVVKVVTQLELKQAETWKKFIGAKSRKTEILDRILDVFPALEPEYCTVRQGYIPYRTTTLVKKFGEKKAKEILKNRSWHSPKKETESHIKEVQGADVGRYTLKWSGTWVKYGKWVSTYLPVEDVFFGERILIREITTKLPYALFCAKAEETFVHNPSVLAVLVKSERLSVNFVLGLLNSRLISEIFLYNSPKAEKGLFPKVIITDAKRLPVPNIQSLMTSHKKEYERTIALVGCILAAKRANPEADTTKWEREIDEMVYQLYDLTPEEIAIVEEATRG